MSTLTAQQASDLSNHFLQLAQSINDFRFNHWNQLNEPQRTHLENLQNNLLTQGEDILAQSTTLVMNDVAISLAQISNVCNQIHGTIATLNNIQKGINVAAALVQLAGVILSKNPQSIGQAIQGLVSAWNQDGSMN